MNTNTEGDWTCGQRIVDLAEFAKQMQCKQCSLQLDLNQAQRESRCGLASILHISCVCGVLNDVHTSRKMKTEKGMFAYAVNAQLTAALMECEIEMDKAMKLLAGLHIPVLSSSSTRRPTHQERAVGPQLNVFGLRTAVCGPTAANIGPMTFCSPSTGLVDNSHENNVPRPWRRTHSRGHHSVFQLSGDSHINSSAAPSVDCQVVGHPHKSMSDTLQADSSVVTSCESLSPGNTVYLGQQTSHPNSVKDILPESSINCTSGCLLEGVNESQTPCADWPLTQELVCNDKSSAESHEEENEGEPDHSGSSGSCPQSDPFVHATNCTVNITTGCMYKGANQRLAEFSGNLARPHEPHRPGVKKTDQGKKRPTKTSSSILSLSKSSAGTETDGDVLLDRLSTEMKAVKTSQDRWPGERPSGCMSGLTVNFAGDMNDNVGGDQSIHSVDNSSPLEVPLAKQQGRKVCDICGLYLCNWYALSRHRQSKHHVGEPLTCPTAGCQKKFARHSLLKSHMQSVHASSKPFQCSRCGKQFGVKRYMTDHMARCGRQPYKCQKCELNFGDRAARRHHIVKHHEGRQQFFSCHCGKVYVHRTSLFKHKKKCRSSS